MYHRNKLIEQTDPELWAAIQLENARQEHHIELDCQRKLRLVYT